MTLCYLNNGAQCHCQPSEGKLCVYDDRRQIDWQPIETAPHATRVLLGWRDWRDHQWCVETGPATTGQRFSNGYSNLSQHGSATHWMPLPPPPQSPQDTKHD